MSENHAARITLDTLREMKRQHRPFAMLTAYDYPTAALAETAGVHSLLVGDSLGNVLLGHANTRGVPLDLMITLAEAVRRGAPRVYLIGDMPWSATRDGERGVVSAARRFLDEARCDAVKIEVTRGELGWVAAATRAGVPVIAHLGLRPQSVLSPNEYRAQARDEASVAALVNDAREMVAAGAVMLLLEAVPNEASAAVVAAVDVPVVGCGAGAACDGHVVVSYDLLGIGNPQPPRFVPVLADIGNRIETAMRRYVADIESRRYPAAKHAYSMRRASEPASP